jgi:hypothetical protein
MRNARRKQSRSRSRRLRLLNQQSAAIDYTPSQYLCEFIKNCGFDGVIYPSSVGAGINLALFDPAKAGPGEVTQYRVAKVSVDIARLEAQTGPAC